MSLLFCSLFVCQSQCNKDVFILALKSEVHLSRFRVLPITTGYVPREDNELVLCRHSIVWNRNSGSEYEQWF